jgi:DNA invertase Pin-like site-specific DNA recombinase
LSIHSGNTGGVFLIIKRKATTGRSKEGLAKAKEQGKLLGRPKGSLDKSQWDDKQQEIERILRIWKTGCTNTIMSGRTADIATWDIGHLKRSKPVK